MAGRAPDFPGQDPGQRRRLPGWVTGITAALDLSGCIIAVLCLALMFAALLLNVVLRYFFSSGIAWAFEIHALLLPWLVAGGIIIAAARGRNIAISVLPDRLGHGRVAVLLFVEATILVICISVLWTSQPILRAAQFQNLSTLGIKQIWGYASLIYAFAGMAIIAAIDILRLLSGEKLGIADPGQSSLS